MEAEGWEEEREQTVTLQEFIENEEGADLVLGADDGKECTYKEGYMPRQAVFSCLTCAPQGNAGVCTACSIVCHDTHKVVELWTKRNFRCDCGNSKFGGNDCKLWKGKDAENKDNAYNQNFAGLYCICHRKYPNPEDDKLGEMLQCCICEDWYHEVHLGLSNSEKVPRDDDHETIYSELICQNCADRCNFLFCYPELLISPTDTAEGKTEAEKTAEANFVTEETITSAGVPFDNGHANGTIEQPKIEISEKPLNEKSSCINGISDVAGCSQSGETSCKLKSRSLKAETQTNSAKALFMDGDWRTEICQCHSCSEMYMSRGLGFLLVKMDTHEDYHAMAEQKRKQEQSDGMKLFQSLGHIQQMELLHGFNDMTSELSTFLKPFSESGKTVTSADIYEFFGQLKKKRKLT